jgi:hypothetical protein
MEPFSLMALGGLIDVVSTGVGAYYQAKDTAAARKEAREMYDAQAVREDRQSAFNNRITSQSAALSKRVNEAAMANDASRLNMDKQKFSYQITRDQMQQIENMLNTNIGLQSTVLNRWAMIGRKAA